MARRGPAAAQANELFTEHVPVDDWFKVWLVEIAAPSASLLANYQSNLRLHTSPELGHLLSRVKELAGFGRFQVGDGGVGKVEVDVDGPVPGQRFVRSDGVDSMRKCSAC
jgi:hypothetical protein